MPVDPLFKGHAYTPARFPPAAPSPALPMFSFFVYFVIFVIFVIFVVTSAP